MRSSRSSPAGGRAADLKASVPDPSRPVDTFERFWTVANLARWDWKLMKGLEEWVRLYTALTGIVDPQQASYLKRTADTAKPFKANFDALTKHLDTPRPGEKGFPGATIEQWTRYLSESYAQLLTVGPPAAPAPAPAASAPATAAGAAPPPPAPALRRRASRVPRSRRPSTRRRRRASTRRGSRS